MYQDVGNQVLAVDPGALIICESVINYRINAYEGDLSVVRSFPVVLRDPTKLVYSVHEYPKEIGGYSGAEFGPEYVARMNKTWGWLVSENVAPVWIGEMGSSMLVAPSKAWGETLLSYMNGEAPNGPKFTGNEQGISGDWWVWGNLSDQVPDGCLAKDGSLRPEQAPLHCEDAAARQDWLPSRRAAVCTRRAARADGNARLQAGDPGLVRQPRRDRLRHLPGYGGGTGGGGTPTARNVSGPPYVDADLENGTRYYYKVRAVGEAGPGAVTETSAVPSISQGTGYYHETFWAGNSAPLSLGDNGAYEDRAREDAVGKIKGRSASHTPAQIVSIFTFQPANANDKPPSAIIIKLSHRDERRPGLQSLGSASNTPAVSNPGLRFARAAGPRAGRRCSRPAASPQPAFRQLHPASLMRRTPSSFRGEPRRHALCKAPTSFCADQAWNGWGSWTQTDGGGGPAGRDAIRLEFSRMTALVPALTRAVREMPDQDRRQAARLLALLGPAARPAIPAVCAALASPEYAGKPPR